LNKKQYFHRLRHQEIERMKLLKIPILCRNLEDLLLAAQHVDPSSTWELDSLVGIIERLSITNLARLGLTVERQDILVELRNLRCSFMRKLTEAEND
jgi:hypothetical protein